MIGTILIEALEIICIIGVHPDERVNPQRILVDCELDYDFAAAAPSDRTIAAVDCHWRAQSNSSV